MWITHHQQTPCRNIRSCTNSEFLKVILSEIKQKLLIPILQNKAQTFDSCFSLCSSQDRNPCKVCTPQHTFARHHCMLFKCTSCKDAYWAPTWQLTNRLTSMRSKYKYVIVLTWKDKILFCRWKIVSLFLQAIIHNYFLSNNSAQ